MQGGSNGAIDEAADSRWMSYAELADVRRITPASAIKLVVRRGWRRQKDNHGVTRALVPPEWSVPAPGRDPDPEGQAAQLISALEASVAELRERAEVAERAMQTERVRADRAELARRAEYSRGDYLRERNDALRALLADAEAAMEIARYEAWQAAQDAEALRRAEAERQQIGRLARLWRAWRGE